LLREGHTEAEIADTLMIAVKTAGHHVSAILAKWGVATRSAALSEGVRLGLPAT
jgi:DNA-binding CsgD family transcriptional regulator